MGLFQGLLNAHGHLGCRVAVDARYMRPSDFSSVTKPMVYTWPADAVLACHSVQELPACSIL